MCNERNKEDHNMKKYLFSIIIPVYNVKDYIKVCMDSLLAQTYKNSMEIILVDDGSSDGSEIICDQYAEQYDFIRVYHKKNEGQSCARNFGIAKAQGKYMIFVDSDDYIEVHTLEILAERIDVLSYPDVVLSDGMYEVNNDGMITKENHYWEKKEFIGVTGKQALKISLKTAANWSPCGKCYKLDFWRKHKFLFVEHRISEDFQLIDRVVLEAEKVDMVSAYYFYRCHRQTSTMHSNYDKLVHDTLLSILDWDKYIKEHVEDTELELRFRKIHAKIFQHDVLAGLYFVSKENRKQTFNEAIPYLYLLRYDTDRESKCIQLCLKVIGIHMTCRLLNILKRFRIYKNQK